MRSAASLRARAAVASALLLWGASQAAATSRSVRSGAELAAALADPGVATVLIQNAIQLHFEDFVGAPIVLGRDVTLEGVTPPDAARPLTLDCNGLRGLVRLGNGTHLTLRRLVLTRWRVMPTQAPGLDLLQPMPEGEAAVLSVLDTALLQDSCFPLQIAKAAAAGVLRPQNVPGTQQWEMPSLLPSNCTDNSAGAYALNRCYAWVAKYVDVWLEGADFAPNYSPRPNGYLVQLAQTFGLCSTVYSAECLATYGALGCVRATLSQRQQSNNTPAAASGPPPPPPTATSDSRAGTALGAAIGGALAGGVLLAALAALAVWAVRRHRRSREPKAATAADRHPSKTKLAADPEGAAAAQAEHGRPHGDGGGGYAHSEAGQHQTGARWIIDNSGQQQLLLPAQSGILSTCTLVITHASPQRAELLPSARLLRLRCSAGGEAASATSGTHSALLRLAGDASSEVAPERSVGARGPAAGEALVTLLPQLLGKGAFGSVYEGVYQGRPVAVKVITETLIDDEDQPAPQQQHLVQPVPGDKAPGSGGAKRSADEDVLPAPDAEQAVLSVTPTAPHGSAGSGGAAAGPTTAPAPSAPASGKQAAFKGGNLSSISSRVDGSGGEKAVDAHRSPRQPPPCEPCAPGARRPRLHELLAREVEVMGRCEHPNIVRLLAACLTPPRLCLVMELMETNLQRLVYTTPARLLPLPTVLHISIQVARGLEYLHPTITHRDLKPANVLINAPDSPWPVAKLADFGFSRMRIATVPTMHPAAGTPAYLAPECYEPDQTVVTHHADLYSLGVLIWAMLTGQEPWKGLSIPAIAMKVASLGERLPLGQLSDRRCPPQLRKIVQGCWEADPRRRPAAAEVAKELESLLQLVASRTHATSGTGGGTSASNSSRHQGIREVAAVHTSLIAPHRQSARPGVGRGAIVPLPGLQPQSTTPATPAPETRRSPDIEGAPSAHGHADVGDLCSHFTMTERELRAQLADVSLDLD